MKRTAVMSVLLAAATAAYAETSQQKPALVSDVQASAQDSPLVQAAKRTVGTRRNVPSVVITNATVAKSAKILTTSNGGARIPDYTSSPSAPAPAPSARSAAPSRASGAGQEAYMQLAASDPRLPQPSQNTSSGSVAGATAPPVVQTSSSSLPQSSASVAVAPRTATNSSYGPAQSQNAGPNRQSRP